MIEKKWKGCFRERERELLPVAFPGSVRGLRGTVRAAGLGERHGPPVPGPFHRLLHQSLPQARQRTGETDHKF